MFICIREGQFPGAGFGWYKFQSIVNHVGGPKIRYEKQNLRDTAEFDAGNRCAIIRSHRSVPSIVYKRSQPAE